MILFFQVMKHPPSPRFVPCTFYYAASSDYFHLALEFLSGLFLLEGEEKMYAVRVSTLQLLTNLL